MKIFISSVQKEFATERKALADYLSGDPLLRRFFETFLFERDVPASDRPPDSVYLAEVRNCDLYPTKYIERMGTGTRDMIKKCISAGLPEPEFSLTDSFVTTIRRVSSVEGPGRGQLTPPVTRQPGSQPESRPVTPPVTPPVAVIVLIRLIGSTGPLGNSEILENLGLSDRTHLRERYIDPALTEALVERTIPEKPTSRLQKYRLTAKGKALLAKLEKQGGNP
jgi:predicted HTH transcriptional regulator